ncbi:hypothetical protein RZE82_04240 [Mollicutes bacterium LVI A0039]|nr:hypothetical protein RZE82_04240 [Mollicutes bacterium LVI A0039]
MDYKIFDRQLFNIKYDRLTQNKSSFSKTYQLLWIVNGSGNLHIGANVIPLCGDQLFFIPIGTTYTVAEQTEILTIKIYLPQKHIKLNEQYRSTMLDVDSQPIKELVATYLYKYNKRADFDIEIESQELIKELLSLAKMSDITLNPVRDQRILQTLEYIDKHTEVRFSVNDITKITAH